MGRFDNYVCDNQITIEDFIKREAATVPTLETRHDSEETVDKNKRYSQIIECLMEKPEATAKEIAVMMLHKGYTFNDDRNNSAPRLTELSKKGVVEPVGKKKCAYTGKTVAVYALRRF